MPEYGCYHSGRSDLEVHAGGFVVVDAQERSWLCTEAPGPTPDPSKATLENAAQSARRRPVRGRPVTLNRFSWL
jgi:hypothetical protein